ncbi:MAG: hypothetical protein ACJAWN_000993 [Neolewinella sp.]|jgi:hypothetical protein
MVEKVAHIDPRQITDIKQLQEMMVLVIYTCDQVHTALQDAQTEIQLLQAVDQKSTPAPNRTDGYPERTRSRLQ